MKGSGRWGLEARSINSLELIPTAEGWRELMVKTVDFLRCFLMVREDLHRNRFARRTQMHEMSLENTKMSKPRIYLPRDPLAWSHCTPLCQARHYSPCYTDCHWSPALPQCLPGFYNEGKGGKVKPSEMEVEKFLFALAAFSVFWAIRLSRNPIGADTLSCFVFAQQLAVRMSSSYLGHLGIRQYKWDY